MKQAELKRLTGELNILTEAILHQLIELPTKRLFVLRDICCMADEAFSRMDELDATQCRVLAGAYVLLARGSNKNEYRNKLAARAVEVAKEGTARALMEGAPERVRVELIVLLAEALCEQQNYEAGLAEYRAAISLQEQRRAPPSDGLVADSMNRYFSDLVQRGPTKH